MKRVPCPHLQFSPCQTCVMATMEQEIIRLTEDNDLLRNKVSDLTAKCAMAEERAADNRIWGLLNAPAITKGPSS